MAIKGAVRFAPDMYKSALESTVGQLNAAASPPTGTVFMPVQLVTYDDTKVGTAGNPYVPGDPASEVHITILYTDTLSMELAAFQGKSQAAATALWTDAITAWRDAVAPAGPNLLKAIRAARIAPPILLG